MYLVVVKSNSVNIYEIASALIMYALVPFSRKRSHILIMLSDNQNRA